MTHATGARRPRRIFVGMQRLRSPDQQRMVAAICDCLAALACVPVLRPHDPEAAAKDPLPAIARTIGECEAAVIVAFARLRIQSAVEFPSSRYARHVSDRALSAVWDHVEAAMAYQAGLPLLILQERGLYQYGIIHTGRTSISFAEFSLAVTDAELQASIGEPIRRWCASLPAVYPR